jgi:hypothetical protein
VPTINLMPPKRKTLNIVFCLPGASFSGEFLTSWSAVLHNCTAYGISPILAQTYDPVVYYARNKCLGGDVLKGKNQKPYNGEIDYDYMLWVDSDIIFNMDHLLKLLKWKKDIVSGVYLMKGGKNFATVVDWDEEYFRKNGCFQFLAPENIEGKTDLIEVSYTGFGFMLVKKGVFEAIEYPWFRPLFHDMGNGVIDFSSEDTSMCKIFKENGFKIHVDPTVKVGHEKVSVL